MPGATAILEAVDLDTGRGLAGVGFESIAEGSADRRDVPSQPTFVDHPVTDDSGKLKVVTEPGRLKFSTGRPPLGYVEMTTASPMLDLAPGRTATFRFEFRKQPEPADKAGKPEEDEVGRRLRGLWEAQSALLQRGRMRVSRTYQAGESIPADRLRASWPRSTPTRSRRSST